MVKDIPDFGQMSCPDAVALERHVKRIVMPSHAGHNLRTSGRHSRRSFLSLTTSESSGRHCADCTRHRRRHPDTTASEVKGNPDFGNVAGSAGSSR